GIAHSIEWKNPRSRAIGPAEASVAGCSPAPRTAGSGPGSQLAVIGPQFRPPAPLDDHQAALVHRVGEVDEGQGSRLPKLDVHRAPIRPLDRGLIPQAHRREALADSLGDGGMTLIERGLLGRRLGPDLTTLP